MGASSFLKESFQLNKLGIVVAPRASFEYILTNRESLHWSGETTKVETRKWHGLVKNRWMTITNFWLDSEYEKTYSGQIMETTVFPHLIELNYLKTKGILTERIFLLRELNVMGIEYSANFFDNVFFRPQVSMRRDWETIGRDHQFSYERSEDTLFISTSSPEYNGPKVIGIKASKKTIFSITGNNLQINYPKDNFRGDGSEFCQVFEPGKLELELDSSNPVLILIALGETKEEVQLLLKDCFKNIDFYWKRTVNPLEDILTSISIQTGKDNWDKAFNWSLLSLDSLFMNINGKGIYAGLHWFPEYWGRDSLITFRGALTFKGKSKIVKDWIRTMIRYQDSESSSRTFGRIPNYISNDRLNYESADSIGWFIYSIWTYFETFGFDKEFLEEIWHSIELGLEGEFSRTDSFGFVTHRERETWMDTMHNGIIATPRADRAIEIQVLYFTSLDIASRLAKKLNKNKLAEDYKSRMRQLQGNILKFFWNGIDNSLFDYLNENNFPNYQKRPNGIFAITLPLIDNLLLTHNQSIDVLNDIHTNCVASHGVRSLTASDPNYHPLHDYGLRKGKEHHDFSYHNGDVWLWLSGPFIEASYTVGNYNIIPKFTEFLIEQLLYNDAIGSLGEILDGTIDNKQIITRGTISQAWSLAEFIRIFFMVWGGIRPLLMENTLELSFSPYFNYLKMFELNIFVKNGQVRLKRIIKSIKQVDYFLESKNIFEKINLELVVLDEFGTLSPKFKGDNKKLGDFQYNKDRKRWHLFLINYLSGVKKFSINLSIEP